MNAVNILNAIKEMDRAMAILCMRASGFANISMVLRTGLRCLEHDE